MPLVYVHPSFMESSPFKEVSSQGWVVWRIVVSYYSPTPLIQTSNNWVSTLSRLQITFQILLLKLAIICMFELIICILVIIYVYFILWHLCLPNCKWWWQLLCTIAIHVMNASVFSCWLLEAVLQLTLTVAFKQLRLHTYHLKGSVWTPE